MIHYLLKYMWQSLVQYGLAVACMLNTDDDQLYQPDGQISGEAEYLPDAGFLDETTLYAWLYSTPVDAKEKSVAPASAPSQSTDRAGIGS
jgi:hypothetical protein